MATIERHPKDTLDRRLDGIGWALFLIMIGGLMLLPAVPSGTWLIGAGLIMLGINAARQMNGVRMSTFSVLLGIGALVLGLAQFTGVNLPVFALLLILIGASILWRAFVE